jgi:hypothetical protein
MSGWGEGLWTASEPTASGDLEIDVRALDEPRLMETLLRFEQAHRRRSLQGMRACFHDEAMIESVASNGRALPPDEQAEALAEAFDDGVYSIRDWRYEEVAPQVVLSWTGARHIVSDARMRDEVVCRLHVGRSGLVWRVKLFRTREEALAHLDEQGPTLGL